MEWDAGTPDAGRYTSMSIFAGVVKWQTRQP